MKNFIISTVFAMAALVAGNAKAANQQFFVDISVGDFVSAVTSLDAGDTAEFRFTALEDMLIGDISLAGTGGLVSDLGLVSYGFTSATESTFPDIIDTGTFSTASGSLPGFNLLSGNSFSIFWKQSASASDIVGVLASFSANAVPDVSQVPLPAGLPLLVAGLGALGLVRRSRRA